MPTLNRYIRLVLLGGMGASLVLMVVGLLLLAARPDGWPDVTLGPVEAFNAIAQGNPVGLIDLGLMLLIATPLARILVALGLFLHGREWKFVAVSLAVLLVIVSAILLKIH